jgi:hypothetical protein
MPYSVPEWVTGTALPWLRDEASVFGNAALIVADVAEAERLCGLRAELEGAILVGVDEKGTADGAPDVFDIYLTTAVEPPRPWVQVQSIADTVKTLGAAVNENPYAAVTLAQVLRAQQSQPFERALQIESFAYSMLLSGAEFHRWLKSAPSPPQQSQTQTPAVMLERDGDILRIELARPESENALTAEMREALVEALRVARMDETVTAVEIRGRGRVFCSGGALHEFGSAHDLVVAHQIRTQHSVALALDRIKAPTRVFIQGTAVGGGIEFAAAGRELIASPTAFFRLPEIGMGLIPGAGGTASIARRIGRERTAYMALSGTKLRARTALTWGLIDRIGDV